MIDKETEKHYESQFSMFSSQGWKDLVDKVKEIRESVDRISSAQTPDEFWKRKGELMQIDWLLGWEDSCRETYEGLKNEADV